MTRRDFIPKDLNDPSLKWGDSDVEWSYTVLAKIDSALAEQPVSVLFKHGGLTPRFNEDHIVFYGTKGAIYIKGHCGTGQLSLWGQEKTRQSVPAPAEIAAAQPDIEGETERCWHYLATEFIRDLRGEKVEPYPTFKEGSQYQQLIDVIRKNENWTDVESLFK